MYIFKNELKEEYLDGRTINYLANKIKVTNAYLCSILNGKRSCGILTAKNISDIQNKDIEYYFNIKEN